ncbi:FAD-dependent oxidoreductase [Deinococcus cellulosilyticus]|uniref:NADH dehydrogenase n=1 Tax=Deinococcus cellulosilyticus (strain DSM 18568 / NBRC 106333 / KACC 11606 / 5516J-15) TaxID=1223518 RepID=A0A511MZN3_DEIC1|nr:FAD-dependent oxidoreductase [Deinococcus cellulosilyticus]GEM46064.1 NADH dehydrogenase [Deinococcus cellulosilyticus NBRC 106333 = KACC 11606]
MKVLIIGGVAGGMSAATRLRRLNEKAEVVVIERGPHVSFANCGLPYHIGGTIEEREKLLLQTPESLHARFNLDVRIQTEALKVNPEEHIVVLKDLRSGKTYEEKYDRLILSPGASPIRPPLPGIEHALTLRNIPDMDRINRHLENSRAEQAVVIGGGFIGLEMAENLVHRGLKVHVVEAGPQVLAPLDPEMAALVQKEVVKQGIKLHLMDALHSIEDQGKRVVLKSGETIPADLIILAIGVKPEVALAKDAGLKLGERGGILESDTLQTSDPDIYAVGDAIEKINLAGEAGLIPLAWSANRQGRLIADHISGRTIHVGHQLGTAIVKVFDLTVATTGLNEKQLQKSGRPFAVVHTHASSHASYYPGAETLSLKLLFNRTTREIYGAQAIGKEGADKRIDVIATAIRGGILADELSDLELAYAPPYSSAKDPVNMLGYMAENLLEGLPTVQWHEVNPEDILLDVRDPHEYTRGHLRGAINIPLNQLRSRHQELPAGPITAYCQVGLRGYLATRLLRQLGHEVRNLDGGYTTFKLGRPDQVTEPVKS